MEPKNRTLLRSSSSSACFPFSLHIGPRVQAAWHRMANWDAIQFHSVLSPFGVNSGGGISHFALQPRIIRRVRNALQVRFSPIDLGFSVDNIPSKITMSKPSAFLVVSATLSAVIFLGFPPAFGEEPEQKIVPLWSDGAPNAIGSEPKDNPNITIHIVKSE